MKNPVVSVIVPVYNAEKYLHRCIDSILAQTFADFELLLIDDGAKDGSGAICDEYAAKNPRLRVFHKPNGGVSSARNLGIDNAKGEWVTFVDSDDWVESDYLRKLLDGCNSDLSVCSFKVNGGNDFSTDLECQTYTGNALSKFLNKYLYVAELSATWCKLYNKRIIDQLNLRFAEDISTREDSIFFLTYLSKVNSIAVTDAKLYHYFAWNGLSMNLQNNSKQYPAILKYYSKAFIVLDRLGITKDMEYAFYREPIYSELRYIQQIPDFNDQMSLTSRLLKNCDVQRAVKALSRPDGADGRCIKILYKLISYQSVVGAVAALNMLRLCGRSI